MWQSCSFSCWIIILYLKICGKIWISEAQQQPVNISLCFGFGPHAIVLRAYFCLGTRGSLLVMLREPYTVPGIELRPAKSKANASTPVLSPAPYGFLRCLLGVVSNTKCPNILICKFSFYNTTLFLCS